jgi:5'-3' exonuclease
MWLLIDTSYIIFAKFFATATWAAQCAAGEGAMGEAFLRRFDEQFVRAVNRAMAHAGVCGYRNVVFCKDCSRSNVWRKRLFPQYKSGRPINGVFDKRIFAHVYTRLLPGLSGSHVVGALRAEADDVIAVLRDRLDKVSVLTNDNDCIQLADSRCRVFNLNLFDVAARRRGMSERQHLLCRILSGDRSDSIPCVIPGRSLVTVVRGSSESDILCALSEPEAARFWRNDHLMNLTRLPPDIVHAVISAAIRSGVLEGPERRLRPDPSFPIWGEIDAPGPTAARAR